MHTNAVQQMHAPRIGLAVRAPSGFVEPEGEIFAEQEWREPRERNGQASTATEITLSRWTADSGCERAASAITPTDCHIVALALKPTRMTLSTRSRQLFEGSVPSGTIFFSAPGQQLQVRVTPPFDFLHLHVENRFLSKNGLTQHEAIVLSGEPEPFRDTLAEALGQSLLDERLQRSQPGYSQIVAKAIVMRAIGHSPVKRRCCALPKWRRKLLDEFLEINIGERVSLDGMATAAGLSKMHFAAQFRAATGFRPHEYLLLKRIERAKAIMAETETSLVEVAFSLGFNAQAHFSTVFKRFTGKSPARWRHEFGLQIASSGENRSC